MWTYYLFMGLLVATLVLWGIAALRDDGHENGSSAPGKADGDACT